jgi:O-antigen/teichoic acid export membrane protein
MLSFLVGNTVVGFYSAAYNLVLPLSLISSLFLRAIFPNMAQLFNTSKKLLVFCYKKSFKYITIVLIPVVIATILLAPKIIFLLYDKSFTLSILPLQILIIAIYFVAIKILVQTLLCAINKQNLIAFAALTGVIINIILNLLMIPNYGHIGAAVATLITEAAVFCIGFYFISKHFHKLLSIKYIYKPIMASFVMGLFIYLADLNLIVLIIGSVIIYLTTLYLIKGFNDNDISLLKKVFR